MDKLPQKGQKSSITQLIQTRYSKACEIITTNVHPTQWVADAVLIDGMFLISHLSMGKPQDHVRLCQLPLKTAHSTTLCLRGKGSTPLFDHPGRYPNSPKVFERARRSAQAESTHTCINFNEATPIPRKWQEIFWHVINAREKSCHSLPLTLQITSVKACAQHSHLSLLEVLKVHSKMKPSWCNYIASPGQIQCYAAMPKKQTPGSDYMLHIQQKQISWLCHLIQMCII